MGIPVVKGRAFDARDTGTAPRVAIVNEAFVREHFPGDDPLGMRIEEGRQGWEIVGVIGDVRSRGLAERVRPMFYRPLAFSHWANGRLIVRARAAPLSLSETVRKAILEVDPDLPVSNIRSLEEVVAASVGQRRLMLLLLALFAAAALLLAAVGLYGVVAYTVTERTREIGIRMALGAQRADVLGMVLLHGARLGGLGIVLGAGVALAVTRVLASQLYDVKPTDPATLAGVALLLFAAALLASWLPARRAASLEPMGALR
jgi:predicted permease